MNYGVPLGRLFGTEIRVHWTWIVVLALITVTFGEGLATQTDLGLDAAAAWACAVVTAALVFVSVTVHELAHVAIARRNGMGGNVVVIQLLGGTYVMEVRPKTWGQELRVALAGPIVSLSLVVVFGILLGAMEIGWGNAATVPQSITAASYATEILALFNVLLAVTNLIPGYPMDGARIVHAIAWARTGREDAATKTASRVGRLVGFGIMAVGAVVVVTVDLWPGMAMMVAGWLLVGSSRILDRRLILQNLVAGAHVSDALDSDPARVPPQLTLDVFAGEYLAERIGGAALVERGQELLGLIGTSQIRRIPRRRWPLMRTEQAMVPVGNVPHTSADAELWPALEILERSGLDGLLIDSGGAVSALFTRRSAARLIRERAEQRALQSVAVLASKGLRGFRLPPAPPGPPATPGPTDATVDAPPDAPQDAPEPPPAVSAEPPADETRKDDDR